MLLPPTIAAAAQYRKGLFMLQLLSLFSGIGAFEKALTNMEVPFNLLGYCEIDESASKSYSAIHGVKADLNLKDVTKVDTSKIQTPVDILTYGFPCQDISQAGHQKGFYNSDGSLTRSGLFFEALRIITHTHPKIAIAENVKALTSSKFSEQFKIVLESLEEAGYNNYWKVLNAKDFGVPQNRERVFIVSIRKDVDSGLFNFPEPFPLKRTLADILEDSVDESFYLSDEQCKRLSGDVFAQANSRLQKKDGVILCLQEITKVLKWFVLHRCTQIVEIHKLEESMTRKESALHLTPAKVEIVK